MTDEQFLNSIQDATRESTPSERLLQLTEAVAQFLDEPDLTSLDARERLHAAFLKALPVDVLQLLR